MATKAKLPFPENLCQDIQKRTYLDHKVDPAGVQLALAQLREELDHPDILLLHYRDGKTLTEIGAMYGVTAERIRQKRNSALWKLRRTLFPGASSIKKGDKL